MVKVLARYPSGSPPPSPTAGSSSGAAPAPALLSAHPRPGVRGLLNHRRHAERKPVSRRRRSDAGPASPLEARRRRGPASSRRRHSHGIAASYSSVQAGDPNVQDRMAALTRRRQELLERQRAAAAVEVQRVYRGRRSRAEATERRRQRELAAVRIQSVHRGRRSRAEVAERRRQRELAAVRIQSVHRGRRSRAEVAALRRDAVGRGRRVSASTAGSYGSDDFEDVDDGGRERELAAVRIQSVHRGRRSRAEVAQLRRERAVSPPRHSRRAGGGAPLTPVHGQVHTPGSSMSGHSLGRSLGADWAETSALSHDHSLSLNVSQSTMAASLPSNALYVSATSLPAPTPSPSRAEQTAASLSGVSDASYSDDDFEAAASDDRRSLDRSRGVSEALSQTIRPSHTSGDDAAVSVDGYSDDAFDEVDTTIASADPVEDTRIRLMSDSSDDDEGSYGSDFDDDDNAPSVVDGGVGEVGFDQLAATTNRSVAGIAEEITSDTDDSYDDDDFS